MRNPQRVQSDVKPLPIKQLGDGIYYYNYDPISVQDMDPIDNKEITKYYSIQVKLRGTPNYKDCVKAVIREYITQDEEFDLINTYNQDQLNGKINQEYLDYIELLRVIKNNIKGDFS